MTHQSLKGPNSMNDTNFPAAAQSPHKPAAAGPDTFAADLDELYRLADEFLDGLEAAGELALPTDGTLYSQCGRKPLWPTWARHPFLDLWARI